MIAFADIDELWRYNAFVRSRRRLLLELEILAAGGRVPVPRSAWTLTRCVRLRVGARPPSVPFGWTARRHWCKYAVEVGPGWYLWTRALVDELQRRFYSLMLYRLKWAYEPYEGCYYHEIKWRFIEETRWPE